MSIMKFTSYIIVLVMTVTMTTGCPDKKSKKNSTTTTTTNNTDSTPTPTPTPEAKVSGRVFLPAATASTVASRQQSTWFAELMTFISPAYAAVPEGQVPVAADAVEIRIYNPETNAYENIPIPQAELDAALTVGTDGEYVIDVGPLIQNGYVTGANAADCIFVFDINLSDGTTIEVKAPAVRTTQLDVSVFSDYLANTLGQSDIDFTNVTLEEISTLLTDIENIDVPADGTLDQVLENIERAAGSFVRAQIDTAQQPPPSDETKAQALGKYNVVSFYQGMFHYDDEGDNFESYGAYDFGSLFEAFEVTAGSGDQVNLAFAGGNVEGSVESGFSVFGHVELLIDSELTDAENAPATLLGNGGLDLTGPAVAESQDFDFDGIPDLYEFCAPEVAIINPLAADFSANVGYSVNRCDEFFADESGNVDFSRLLSAEADVGLILTGKQAPLSNADFSRDIGIVAMGADYDSGGTLRNIVSVVKGVRQPGEEPRFCMDFEDYEISRFAQNAPIEFEAGSEACNPATPDEDNIFEFVINPANDGRISILETEVSSGLADAPLGFGGFATAGGNFFAATVAAVTCPGVANDNQIGCQEDVEGESSTADEQALAFLAGVPLPTSTLDLTGAVFTFHSMESSFDDPGQGVFHEVCRGLQISFTDTSNLQLEDAGENCSFVETFADTAIPESGSDDGEEASSTPLPYTLSPTGDFVMDASSLSPGTIVVKGFVSADGQILIMGLAEQIAADDAYVAWFIGNRE